MKKTIAILGITVLSLSVLAPRSNAGVSVHFGGGLRISAPTCAPAVAMAPIAPCAPVYGSVALPAPVLVHPAPPRVHVSIPVPLPVIHFRPPFLDVGIGFGHHRHHHRHARSHRHCR